MQRDHWWTVSRNFSQPEDAHVVGKSWSQGGAESWSEENKNTKVPVLYDAVVASSILGHFVSAISGAALYKKQSFLVDSFGKNFFPLCRNIRSSKVERALGSSPFDQKGYTPKIGKSLIRER